MVDILQVKVCNIHTEDTQLLREMCEHHANAVLMQNCTS